MGQPKISVALGGAGENLGRFRWGRFSARRRFGWGPPFRRFGWGPNKKFRFRWGRQNDCACGARSAGRDQGCVGWSSARTLRGHVLLCSRWTCSRVTDARTTPRERYARSGFPGGHFPRPSFCGSSCVFFPHFRVPTGGKNPMDFGKPNPAPGKNLSVPLMPASALLIPCFAEAILHRPPPALTATLARLSFRKLHAGRHGH